MLFRGFNLLKSCETIYITGDYIESYNEINKKSFYFNKHSNIGDLNITAETLKIK